MDKRGENSFSEEVRSGRKTRESFGYGPKSAVTEQQGHRTQSEANGCCDWQEGDKKKYHPCAINNLWKTDFPPLHSMCSIFNFNQKQVRPENVQAGK